MQQRMSRHQEGNDDDDDADQQKDSSLGFPKNGRQKATTTPIVHFCMYFGSVFDMKTKGMRRPTGEVRTVVLMVSLCAFLRAEIYDC